MKVRNKQQPIGGMYEGSHESGIPGNQRRDRIICLCPYNAEMWGKSVK